MNPKIKLAHEKFDEINAQDPNFIDWENQSFPKELLYHRWLHEWVLKLDPKPSEALLLASKSQHIARWKIARSSYPEGRIGYLTWRKDLYQFHADVTKEILEELQFEQNTITNCLKIILKKDLKSNPDTQTMEDALCLVFLQHQANDFFKKTTKEKIPTIVEKTLQKMSTKAKQLAKDFSLL